MEGVMKQTTNISKTRQRKLSEKEMEAIVKDHADHREQNLKAFDYNFETESNIIIKNIALEIVGEGTQDGLKITQELAEYMVKIKLLNPRHGFTASEVMPRSLTQQLVAMVVEDLKLFNPSMNCIRMQVFWNSSNLNIDSIKNQFVQSLSEKAYPYLNEMVWGLSRSGSPQESSRKSGGMSMSHLLTFYIIISRNLGSLNHSAHIRETAAAVFSVFKHRDAQAMSHLSPEEKMTRISELADRVAGIRLFLKHIGRAGEGIEEVKNLSAKIESIRKEVSAQDKKVTARIEDLRKIISFAISMDLFEDVAEPGEVNLPPDCSMEDFIHLKKIFVIMLQYSFYLSDLMSKLDEVDGTTNVFYKQFKETMQKLQATIRCREAVPTSDVYDHFERAGVIYLEIQAYSHYLKFFKRILKNLEHINKRHYFIKTKIEKILLEKMNDKKGSKDVLNGFPEGSKTFSKTFSKTLIQHYNEDITLEFRGFCPTTLFYTQGLLIPAVPEAGILQHKDKYYGFADKRRYEVLAKNPEYYLMKIYEFLRDNPEMIDLLNVYEDLYNIKSKTEEVKVDKKVLLRTEDTQTVLHPIEEYWDKDYTFSIWELKKRALALTRLVKCVTKSVQTFSPQSHFRASIGLLAAPNKDKEVQTKKDSSCVHSAISNYLYGLRGHREDKFRVIELTRPVEEIYEKKIILEEGDPCTQRREEKIDDEPYPPLTIYEKCNCYDAGELSDQSAQQP